MKEIYKALILRVNRLFSLTLCKSWTFFANTTFLLINQFEKSEKNFFILFHNSILYSKRI